MEYSFPESVTFTLVALLFESNIGPSGLSFLTTCGGQEAPSKPHLLLFLPLCDPLPCDFKPKDLKIQNIELKSTIDHFCDYLT